MIKKILTMIAIGTILSGCSVTEALWGHKRLNTNRAGSLVPIDERAIISHWKDDATGGRAIVCAEPSPDGMTALSLSASGKSDKLDLVAALSAQQNSSFVGLRTQSIQLLRDAMYRSCEGYLSGALTKSAYDIAMRRYQKNMVALLAIEQLTGTVAAPTTTITTQGAASAGTELKAYRDSISTAKDDKKSLEEAIAAEKAVLATATSAADQTAIDASNAKLLDFGEKRKELDTHISQLEEGASKAGELAAMGRGSVNVTQNVGSAKPSDASIQAVAQHVRDIVSSVVQADDGDQLCLTALVTAYHESESSSQRLALLKAKAELGPNSKTSQARAGLRHRPRGKGRTPKNLELESLIDTQPEIDGANWVGFDSATLNSGNSQTTAKDTFIEFCKSRLNAANVQRSTSLSLTNSYVDTLIQAAAKIIQDPTATKEEVKEASAMLQQAGNYVSNSANSGIMRMMKAQ